MAPQSLVPPVGQRRSAACVSFEQRQHKRWAPLNRWCLLDKDELCNVPILPRIWGVTCHQIYQLDVPVPPWSSSDTRAEHVEVASLQLNIYQHRECRGPSLTRFLHHDPSHQFVFVPLVDMDCKVDTPFWRSRANLGAPPWWEMSRPVISSSCGTRRMHKNFRIWKMM